jgi:hypothetical protein
MPMPTYLPKHYKTLTTQVAKGDSFLDASYEQGWRVVTMALHPDGKQVTVLMEKQFPAPS